MGARKRVSSMKTVSSVSGVLSMCGAVYDNSTQLRANKINEGVALCRVCGVCMRARACTRFFLHSFSSRQHHKKLYAKAERPNKPNTPHSIWLNALNLKGLKCVGFVLGTELFVWGSVLGQKA